MDMKDELKIILVQLENTIYQQTKILEEVRDIFEYQFPNAGKNMRELRGQEPRF